MEDSVITSCISQGIVKWSDIADRINGRIGKQCRERWFNHLDPTLKKGDWSEGEDAVLVEAQRRWGNCWTKIARLLNGRSENAVKNRWNSATRRRAKDGSGSMSTGNGGNYSQAFNYIGQPTSGEGSDHSVSAVLREARKQALKIVDAAVAKEEREARANGSGGKKKTTAGANPTEDEDDSISLSKGQRVALHVGGTNSATAIGGYDEDVLVDSDFLNFDAPPSSSSAANNDSSVDDDERMDQTDESTRGGSDGSPRDNNDNGTSFATVTAEASSSDDENNKCHQQAAVNHVTMPSSDDDDQNQDDDADDDHSLSTTLLNMSLDNDSDLMIEVGLTLIGDSSKERARLLSIPLRTSGSFGFGQDEEEEGEGVPSSSFAGDRRSISPLPALNLSGGERPDEDSQSSGEGGEEEEEEDVDPNQLNADQSIGGDDLSTDLAQFMGSQDLEWSINNNEDEER
jgi:hypothetical protein